MADYVVSTAPDQEEALQKVSSQEGITAQTYLQRQIDLRLAPLIELVRADVVKDIVIALRTADDVKLSAVRDTLGLEAKLVAAREESPV